MADLHTNGTANRAPTGVQRRGDLVARLRAAATSGDMPLGQAFDAAAVADEIERLRGAIDAVLAEIDAYHRPNSDGRGCWWCMSTSWPCVHRMVLDELIGARHDR